MGSEWAILSSHSSGRPHLVLPPSSRDGGVVFLLAVMTSLYIFYAVQTSTSSRESHSSCLTVRPAYPRHDRCLGREVAKMHIQPYGACLHSSGSCAMYSVRSSFTVFPCRAA